MEKISVCLRLRPLNQKEQQEGDIVAWETHEQKIQLNKSCLKELISQKKVVNSLIYEFNHCYSQQTDNYQLFSTSVKSVIMQSLDGINGTIIMYGQTGSGKTFTMLGKKNQELLQNHNGNIQQIIKDSFANNQYNDVGILVYAMMELFKQINLDEKRQFEVKCSYYEIYNEFIYDLLKEENELQEPLIFGTDYRKEFVIKNIKEFNVTSIEDVMSCIQKGENNRHYAETILNHQSSRSHTIFKVLISAYSSDTEEDDNFTFSTEACINFIDLAGSEKISSTPLGEDQIKNSSRKERNKESSAINKSLFFLTRVIALKTQKVPPQHIPYRNSTLTKLLKSSLIGNFKTLIILSINPGLSQYDQTNSTLRFGMSAKLVESKIEQNLHFDVSQANNQQKLNQLIQKNKQNEKIIQDQQQTIETLQQQLLAQNCLDVLSNLKQGDVQLGTKPSVSQFSETDVSQMEKARELSVQLQQEIEKNQLLEKNCTELHKRLQQSNNQILTYFNSHKEMEDQLKDLQQKNQNLEKLTQSALNKLQCYEGQPIFKKMGLDEIQNLEYHMLKCLEEIKLEKIRRNSFSQINMETMPLFTQATETICSDRSNVSQDFKKIEQDESPVRKSVSKTNKKEAKVQQTKKQQQSYFKAPSSRLSTLSNNQESKSPLLKKPNLREAQNFAKKIQNQKNVQQQQLNEYRSKSSEKDQNKQCSNPQQEQNKLKNDIQSLADRLYTLSEKFQLKSVSEIKQKRNENANKTDIIYETESELIDSRVTIHKSNRSALK